MKGSRVSPSLKLAVVIYRLGANLRALMRYRITLPFTSAAGGKKIVPHVMVTAAKQVVTGAVDRAQNATAGIHKTLNTRLFRLHSPQALASFTILTAFLVWLTLANIPTRPREHDLPLPDADFSSKLKEDKAPGAEEPARFLPENDPSWQLSPPGVPLTAPAGFVPAAADEHKTDLASDAQPGEATMNNHLKIGTLHVALLGGLFSAPLVPVLADDKPAPGETADRLGKIERSILDLKAQVQKLEESYKTIKDADYLTPIRTDVAGLKADVAKLQESPKKVEARKQAFEDNRNAEQPPIDIAERVRRIEQMLENMPLTVQAHSRDLIQMRQEVDQLRRDVGRLQQDLERERTRISRYPPPSVDGRIQLTNAWFESKTVIVDGVAYRLAPGETRTINKPAGTFSYEVVGVTQPGQVRTVTAGETFNIRIGVPQS